MPAPAELNWLMEVGLWHSRMPMSRHASAGGDGSESERGRARERERERERASEGMGERERGRRPAPSLQTFCLATGQPNQSTSQSANKPPETQIPSNTAHPRKKHTSTHTHTSHQINLNALLCNSEKC